MKNIRFFYTENFHSSVIKVSVYFNRHVFVMYRILGMHFFAFVLNVLVVHVN